MLRETDGAWFSRLLQHPARKWNGYILTTPQPARGNKMQYSSERALHMAAIVPQIFLHYNDMLTASQADLADHRCGDVHRFAPSRSWHSHSWPAQRCHVHSSLMRIPQTTPMYCCRSHDLPCLESWFQQP